MKKKTFHVNNNIFNMSSKFIRMMIIPSFMATLASISVSEELKDRYKNHITKTTMSILVGSYIYIAVSFIQALFPEEMVIGAFVTSTVGALLFAMKNNFYIEN